VETPPLLQKPQHKFDPNPLTPAWLLKGTNIKPTKPLDKFFSTLTMISLEEKKLTQISSLERLPGLMMLHLGHNCITRIEGLENLPLLKTLKLDNNFIQKIEGLDSQHNLTKLCLEHNEIDRLEGL
jgi:Leucine-rich repeat (LRR) protein